MLVDCGPVKLNHHDAWFDGELLDMRTEQGVPLIDDMPPLTPVDDTSQFGEARLIQRALAWHVEEPFTYLCWEIGAGDGKTLSNTYPFRQYGWRAVLVERDQAKAPQADATCPIVVTAELTPGQLDDYMPAAADFGVIDIDGDDFAMWLHLEHKPSLMLIEYNCYGDPAKAWEPEGSGFLRAAGMYPLIELGKIKGYRLLARTYCNLLFINDG